MTRLKLVSCSTDTGDDFDNVGASRRMLALWPMIIDTLGILFCSFLDFSSAYATGGFLDFFFDSTSIDTDDLADNNEKLDNDYNFESFCGPFDGGNNN